MTLITSSIPNLINGISQQPPTLRLASQAEKQVNFLSSVSDGLTVRPPTRHLAVLDNNDWSDAFIHTINRDTVERYLVVIRDGAIRVFEAETGVERTVEAPSGFGYLTGATAQDFRAVSVADYTFILNSKVTVAVDPELTPERRNEALIYVKGGNYGRRYKVYVDGVEAANYRTPNGANASDVNDIDTGSIASELKDDLDAWNNGDYTITLRGDLIIIQRNDSTSFSVRAEDGTGGTNIDAIQSQVQRFSDLPGDGYPGFRVEVVGGQSSSFDNYFVEFQTEGGDGVGVWKESIAGGETFKFDPTTMPHTLVRRADGVFEFNTPEWSEREVGDLDKNPHPSFVGHTIRDVFFFQNRLGFAADENVILSQDGEYFDFYRSTATTLLDTDPIDVALTSERVSIINHAVPFNKTLLLFSDQSQFVMESGGLLTPQSVSVAQSTAFESLQSVRPVGVGQYVYFPVPRGNNAGLREYFVQEGGEQNDAMDVSSHAPRYLPRNLTHLVASSAEDTIICLAEDERNSMWVYRFFFTSDGKLQSAWSKWTFSQEDIIQSVSFLESDLYMVVSRDGQTFIDVLNLESSASDDDSTVVFRADRGVTEQQCLVAFDGQFTTFTLPYTTAETLHVVARGGDDNFSEGQVLPYDRPSSDTVRLAGDQTGTKLIIGQQFTACYQFSTFFIRSPESGGGVSTNSDGRLQLRYLSIDYSRAGYFKLTSQPRGRAITEKSFSGRLTGANSATAGELNLATGRFKVPVMCRNTDADIQIICESHLPASFTAAEWEATYTSRARKV